MSESNSQHGTRIEIWVRNHAPNGASDVQETVRDRLRQIKDEGTITEISLNTWGGRIGAAAKDTSAEFDPPEREVIETFAIWASDHRYSLQPAFETREIDLLTTEETREVIVPPLICLAVYDGNDLQEVFPYSDGEEVHTVDECLDRLEAGDDRLTADTPDIAAKG